MTQIKKPSSQKNKKQEEKKILSWQEYEEFVRFGLKLVPNLEELRKRRIKSAPQIKFSL